MTGVCEDFLYDYQEPTAPGGRCAAVLAPGNNQVRTAALYSRDVPDSARIVSRMTSRITSLARILATRLPTTPTWLASPLVTPYW